MHYTPVKTYQQQIQYLERKLTAKQLFEVKQRVLYYNKLSHDDSQFSGSHKIDDLKKPKSPKAYYHDTYEYARFFDGKFSLNYVFGDVTFVPPVPSIVKSRPIGDSNKNSVLLNLDKARHFTWVKDDEQFDLKKNQLIGRGAIFGHQQNRIDFYRKYFNHPLCDLGQTNDYGDFGWQKPKISVQEHLRYKFVLSLQGNDVATNLKWIMSSNSIAVMPKPTMETWFMEGKLEGGTHYIETADDFSDLEEKLMYYIEHPHLCQEIIRNAQAFCEQFYDDNVEDLCSLKVVAKYLKRVKNNPQDLA